MNMKLKDLELKELKEFLDQYVYVKSVVSKMISSIDDLKFISKINVKITVLEYLTLTP